MESISPYFFGLLIIVAIYLGGYFAFRFKHNIKLLIAFCGGALVAAALVDILPEAFELSGEGNIRWIMLSVILSFLLFLLLDKFLFTHGHSHSDCECEEIREHNVVEKSSSPTGILFSSGILLHTLIDGIVIGTSFMVNTSTGILIAIILLFHDFTDGISTVTVMLHSNQSRKSIRITLLVAGLATMVGIFISQIFRFDNFFLSYLLGIFAGLFLYLGASDLLPEAHQDRSSLPLVLATVAGAGVVSILGILM